MTTFDDFIAEIETEARAQGPDAVAELEAFRLHFSLARQLAAQRRAQHLTQKQLAKRSGIDQAEISRIERGQANPTTATLGALTGALGLDVHSSPATAPSDHRSVPRALNAWQPSDPPPQRINPSTARLKKSGRRDLSPGPLAPKIQQGCGIPLLAGIDAT